MRYKHIKPLSEQTLNEINMSPSSLRQAASKIDARVGMEFEMYVPDANGDDDDSRSQEPNYEEDEPADNIDNIIEFFDDNEHNDRYSINRLRTALDRDFGEWLQTKQEDDWEENKEEAVLDYIKDNYREESLETALEQLTNELPDTTLDKDSQLVLVRARQIMGQMAEDAISSEDNIYDEAKSQWEDEWHDDHYPDDMQSDWLEHEGYRMMSDIENSYQINWTHWGGSDNEGRSLDEIAEEFSQHIGRPASEGGHDESSYGVTTDGSLSYAENDGDGGIEFISPPLTISEMLSDLQKVKQYAEKTGAYTNSSCGLHINVSVPGFTGYDLDFVKLALLLGDEHVLKEFGRVGSRFAASALGVVKSNIRKSPEEVASILNKMKEGLDQMASKAIHSGDTHKFTSINNKGDYIEFRAAGNDWLGTNFDKIENTMLRYVVALDAAMDPKKHREEYLKKFYKALAGDQKNDVIEHFVKYAAGEMPKQALKSFIRQVQTQRQSAGMGTATPAAVAASQPAQAPVNDTTPVGTPRRWAVLNAADNPVAFVMAATQSEANTKAAQQLRASNPGINLGEFSVVPDAGQFQQVQQQVQQTQPAQETYQIYRLSDGQTVHSYAADNQFTAWGMGQQWVEAQGGVLNQYSVRRAEA